MNNKLLNSFRRGFNEKILQNITPVMDFNNLPIRSGGNMDVPPQLSVVIPVYNVDEWLADCLKSIQAQTFTAWECWLIDDGSTDASGRICDIYAKQDSRFQVIHQENRGVSAARNVGIKVAKAPLLSFIDPDDFISENYFQAQISALQENEVDMSFSGTECVDSSGVLIPFPTKQEYRQYKKLSDKESVRNQFGKMHNCASWGKLFTRKLWGNSMFPEGIDLGEDVLCVPFVQFSANSAVYVPESKYYHRHRAGSLTYKVNYERMQREIWAINYTIRALVCYAPEMTLQLEELKEEFCLSRIIDYFGEKRMSVISILVKSISILEEAEMRQKNGYYRKLEEQIEKQKENERV